MTMTELNEDGKVLAEGSIWRLYFEPGKTPTEEELAGLTGAVKTTLVAAPPADPHAYVTPNYEGGRK